MTVENQIIEKKILRNYALRIGLLAALIELAILYGSYYAGMEVFTSVKVVSVFIPYIIILLLLTGLSLRKKLGGYLTFLQGLQFAFIVYIISEILLAIGVYILYNVIDPDLTAKTIQMQAERTRIMMEKMNAPATDIEEAVNKIKNTEPKTGLKHTILGVGVYFIYDFMKSVIIAFLIKRERKLS